MEPSEAAKLRELEAENNKLNKLLAKAHIDIHALKSLFSVKRYPYKLSAMRSRR
jgi:putative transposase